MRTWLPLALCASLVFPIAAQADRLALHATIQDTSDADVGIGPGVKYVFETGNQVKVDGRVSWMHYPDIDLDIIPLEVAVSLLLPTEGALAPYVGTGLGFYIAEGNRGDVDDDMGYQVFLGGEWEVGVDMYFFTELRWRWLHPDADDEFAAREGTGTSVDLDGFGVNAGLVYSF